MTTATRQSTGIPALDERLGGGLIPGTLSVVLGASGIGKTQLGVSYLHAGLAQEGASGAIFDLSARIDSQAHLAYARRMFDLSIEEHSPGPFVAADFFTRAARAGNYLRVFETSGRRVNHHDVSDDTWHSWQVELAAELERTIEYFYANFVRGVRRVVIDGVEPAGRPSESIQHELFEYVYHQILRKEASWVARDLFRQSYREHAEAIERHSYDHEHVGAMLLLTSHESMLDALIERPLVDGDLLATANTLIYLGKTRRGQSLGRAMYIAKHRGSACSDELIPFTITERGIVLDA